MGMLLHDSLYEETTSYCTHVLHVVAVISLVYHKIRYGKQKPGVSDQTYISFLSPAHSLTRLRMRKN